MTARTGSARALIVDASLLPSLLFQLFIHFKFSKSLLYKKSRYFLLLFILHTIISFNDIKLQKKHINFSTHWHVTFRTTQCREQVDSGNVSITARSAKSRCWPNHACNKEWLRMNVVILLFGFYHYTLLFHLYLCPTMLRLANL